MQLTIEKLKEIIIQEASNIKPEHIEDSKEPLTNQGVDSLDLSSIFLIIEEDFGVTIPDEDLDQVQSIDDIIKYVNSKA